jgi:CHASE2 domain-containing sensor protein
MLALVPIMIAGLLLATAIIAITSILAVAALFMPIAATIIAIIVLGERGGSCQQAHCHQNGKNGFGVHVNSL